VPAKKMRAEICDESGNRYTITFEGRVTREKALRVLDIVELLGGMPSIESTIEHSAEFSKIDKIRFVLKKHFPVVWFSAKDIQPIYEEEIKEPISLSTISTYLSRLTDRGLLIKSRNSNRVLYRVISEDLRKVLKMSE